MEAKQQLLRLLRIQELANEIRTAQQVLAEAPERIEQIEGRFRERNAAYVAAKERHDELDQDQRTRTNELGQLEEKRKKYMDDLMQVQNQREYAAMLKEIDAVKALIAEHEEAILKDMEQIEQLTGDLQTQQEHIQQEREVVDRERAAVEAEAAAARELIERRGAERLQVESSLPEPLLTTLRKLEETRQGVFLSPVEHGTCQSCFVRVRPQALQEIRSAAAVHACGSCRRFLYVESALRVGAGHAGAGDNIEALNGGTL